MKTNKNLYEQVAKSFIKETKAPIPLYREEDFKYYLDLFEPVSNIKSDFESYLSKLVDIGVDEYYIMRSNLKEEIINKVKSKESYSNFINNDFKKYGDRFEPVNKGTTLLTMENVDKKWISVDMVKANFNTFRTFDEDLVDGFTNFEDWISSFENGEEFKDIKILRQIIFGELNPKRIQTIQRYYMSKLIETILNKDSDDLRVITLGADEILFEFKDGLVDTIKKSIEEFKYFDNNKFEFRVDVFELKAINKKIKDYGFIKVFDNKEEFVGVSKNMFAQAYKYYKGLEVTDNDLKFYMDGVVATYEEPLYKKLESKKEENF